VSTHSKHRVFLQIRLEVRGFLTCNAAEGKMALEARDLLV